MKSTVLDDARAVGARDAFDADDGAELIEFTPAQFTAFVERIEMRAREQERELIARRWDGCECDLVCIGAIDIGAAIRQDAALEAEAAKLRAAAGEQTK